MNSLRNGREQAPRSQVQPDLEKERQNCPFSQEEITNLIDGGPEKTAERRNLEEYFFRHTEVLQTKNTFNSSEFSRPFKLFRVQMEFDIWREKSECRTFISCQIAPWGF